MLAKKWNNQSFHASLGGEKNSTMTSENDLAFPYNIMLPIYTF